MYFSMRKSYFSMRKSNTMSWFENTIQQLLEFLKNVFNLSLIVNPGPILVFGDIYIFFRKCVLPFIEFKMNHIFK